MFIQKLFKYFSLNSMTFIRIRIGMEMGSAKKTFHIWSSENQKNINQPLDIGEWRQSLPGKRSCHSALYLKILTISWIRYQSYRYTLSDFRVGTHVAYPLHTSLPFISPLPPPLAAPQTPHPYWTAVLTICFKKMVNMMKTNKKNIPWLYCIRCYICFFFFFSNLSSFWKKTLFLQTYYEMREKGNFDYQIRKSAEYFDTKLVREMAWSLRALVLKIKFLFLLWHFFSS